MNNEIKNSVDTIHESTENLTDSTVMKKPDILKKRKKKSGKKRVFAFVILVIILGAIALRLPVVREFFELKEGEGTTVSVEIPQGASADTIADILIEKNIIESKLAFRLKLKFHEKGNELKYGQYSLNTSMTLSEIIEELSKGHQIGKPITIPEGYSAEMIGQLCEEKGICTKEEFLYTLDNEVYDFGFLKYIPSNPELKHRLQGFLFPDTYEYNAATTAKDIINNMLETYEKNVAIPENGNLTYYEILTLASIVEREAKIDGERAKIAGVFMNRLDIKMPLQACATVIYAKSDGVYDMEEVLFSDLEVKSPYNTYKNSGLPIGPICNPGKAAIEAVLNPEKHSYLYYHTDEKKNDGSHIFTESYSEHSATQIK